MKRSRLLVTLAFGALLALGIAGSAGAHVRGTPNCDTKRRVVEGVGHRPHAYRYVTAASSRRVRVYSDLGNDFGSVYYACWRATGRSHRLAVNTGGAQVYDAYVRDVTIAGRFVAFSFSASGDDPDNYDRFVVVDAATGRFVRDVKVPQPAGDRPPVALALTAAAAIAYESGGILHAADARGDRVLATATPQAPISHVTASGHTVRWIQNDAVHSAALAAGDDRDTATS